MAQFELQTHSQLLWTAIVAIALALVALDQASIASRGHPEEAPASDQILHERDQFGVDARPLPPLRRPAYQR